MISGIFHVMVVLTDKQLETHGCVIRVVATAIMTGHMVDSRDKAALNISEVLFKHVNNRWFAILQKLTGKLWTWKYNLLTIDFQFSNRNYGTHLNNTCVYMWINLCVLLVNDDYVMLHFKLDNKTCASHFTVIMLYVAFIPVPKYF